jgi:hypothetical protein
VRRHILRVTGVGILAGLALTGAAPPATARPKLGVQDPGSPLTGPEIAITLQVARLGAVYPVPFPDFGEAGPAVSRATAERLRARLPEIGAGRLLLVRDGARALAAAGLTAVSRDRLLDGLAGLTAKTSAKTSAQASTKTGPETGAETGAEMGAEMGPSMSPEMSPEMSTAPALVALTALAVATVSTAFSPDDDAAALFWLGGLRQRHLDATKGPS